MTFTHTLPIGNYGPAKFIVATSVANGTHTTLASALAAASVGDTVFLRDSVTENVTIPAGINIANFNNGGINTPSITGTITMTAAGTSNVIGVRLITNSAAIIAVTGSAASVLNVTNCYLGMTNATGITYSSSSASSAINFYGCTGDLGTTGIAIYSQSSPGALSFIETIITNSGGSTTQSSNSAGTTGWSWGGCFSPLACSGGTLVFQWGFVNTITQNVTCFTTSGTAMLALHGASSMASGSASAISVGSGTTCNNYGIIEVNSTNTNAITGAGLFQYGLVVYSGTSSTNNVTTQTAFVTQPAIPSSSGAVVQQVRTSTSTNATFTTTYALGSIPTTSGGTQFLSQAITPTNSSHILLIEYEYFAGISAPSSATDSVISGIFQDSTTNALYAQVDLNIGAVAGGLVGSASVKGRYFMIAGTTSATTFKVRLGVTGGTGYFLENPAGTTLGGVQFASLTITEYTS